MKRHRLWRVAGPAILLAVGGAYALASANWCGRWPAMPPAVTASGLSAEPLSAGAAKVALTPPYPIVKAGYGPLRPTARTAQEPLAARALVVASGAVKVALVSADVLLVPAEVAASIRERLRGLNLSAVLVAATHTHGSFGGYDPRLMSELAATGRYDEAAQAALVTAAVEAVEKAAQALAPVTLHAGALKDEALVASRPGGVSPDARLTRLVFRGAGGDVGQLVVFAAHPTLHPRDSDQLSPDYPGPLSEALEAQGGVALFVNGAVANTMARLDVGRTARAYGVAIAERASKLELQAQPPRLGFATVTVALPRPDSSRLVPRLTRAAGDNFLCASSDRQTEVALLDLGGTRLLLLPAEVSHLASVSLEAAAGGARTVSMAGGYIGYLEARDLVARAEGESRRQYFGGALIDVIEAGVSAAAGRLPRPPP